MKRLQIAIIALRMAVLGVVEIICVWKHPTLVSQHLVVIKMKAVEPLVLATVGKPLQTNVQ